MDSIEENIAEYRESIRGIRARIEELNEKIAVRRLEGRAVKDLLDRRVTLYMQMGDLQYSLGSLEEYISQTTRRGESV